MSVIIGAGKYVFGEDIPEGKYDLKVLKGNGLLTIRLGMSKDDEIQMLFGLMDGFTKTYNNINGKKGYFFSIQDDVEVEVTKSKTLDIE